MVSHGEQFNIRWNNYTSVLQSVFRKLLEGEQFVDVTLTCEGKSIKCHRVILSACSTYFEKILSENAYPQLVILLKDMKFWELEALVTFMYNGEVSVNQKRLSNLVKAAQSLKIKGLAPDSSFSPSDSEKIDDDDIEEEFPIGRFAKGEKDIERPSLQYPNDHSILRENLYSTSSKSCIKRKIVTARPKLVKMPKIEKKTAEVVMCSGSGRQQREHNTGEATISTHGIGSDDDTVDDNQDCAITDELMNEDDYSETENNDDMENAHEEGADINGGGDCSTLAEATDAQDYTKGDNEVDVNATGEQNTNAMLNNIIHFVINAKINGNAFNRL